MGNRTRTGTTVALAALLSTAACKVPVDRFTAVDYESHAAFPIEQGAHGGMNCNECHGAFDTFTQFTCIDCHTHDQARTDGDHAGVDGYRYDSIACYECHADGSLTVGPEHELKFPIADGTAHADVACSECHVVPGDRTQVDCATCHSAAETNPQHGPVGGYTHATAGCLRCHADSQVDRVSSHLPFRIGGGSDHYREDCLRCHPATRADKPFPAADFGRFDCLTCHSRAATDREHDDEGGYRYESGACYNCHRTGEKGDDD